MRRILPTMGLLGMLLMGCKQVETTEQEAPLVTPSASVARTEPPESIPPSEPEPRPVVLIAGGDVDLSRSTGQRILRDPSHDPFSEIRPLLKAADFRFANLESQLCDLGGKTVSEHNRLIFSGPPGGAEVLQRGGFDIVSTANNHAWDFGLRCLEETISNLQRVGITHVGTDETGKDPMRPVKMERNGQRFAFFAVTGIFNHGPLSVHQAKDYVAGADMGALRRRIAEIRDRVDRVIVSVHIGQEYQHIPIEATRSALFGAVDAGADLVLGHHTHTPQRVEFYNGVAVVMSLGNFVFHQHREHPWTAWGYLARATIPPGGEIELEICPFYIFNAIPRPPTHKQEAVFYHHWDRISKAPLSGRRTERSEDGCIRLEPPES